MPLSGGLFTRLYSWVTDRDAAVKIRADRMDAEFDGMATALSTAMYKDGQQVATASQSMGGFGFLNVGNTVLGHTANLAIGGNADRLEVIGTTAATGGLAIAAFSTTQSISGHIDFYKSASASIGSATVVANGEVISQITAYGAQQTGTFATQNPAAQWRMEVAGVVTSGAGGDMPGRHVWATTGDGSGILTDRLILGPSGILSPATDGGVQLGSSSLGYNSFFLATGSQINFAAGDVTILHSANGLAFAGASNGYTFDAAIKPSANDAAALGVSGTGWSDLFGATGFVLNLGAGDLTWTHSSGNWALGGSAADVILDLSAANASNIKFGNANDSSNTATLDGYTDWIAYTPTYTGFGTVSATSIYSKRVGDTLYIRGRFTAGTPTGVEARLTLGFNGTNANVNSDATKVSAIQVCGNAGRNTAGSATYYSMIESNVGYITFSAQSGTSHILTKINGDALVATGGVCTFQAEIPISGW